MCKTLVWIPIRIGIKMECRIRNRITTLMFIEDKINLLLSWKKDSELKKYIKIKTNPLLEFSMEENN